MIKIDIITVTEIISHSIGSRSNLAFGFGPVVISISDIKINRFCAV